MKDEAAFEKYRKRLVKESVLKSLFYGVIFGCAALAVVAFFTWLFGYKPGLFFALAAFVAVTAALTPIFYFLKFRPTTKQIARRVDELGLEERVLTMTELEGDGSYIAQVQREDTMHAMSSVSGMLLKIAISVSLIVAFSVACVFGAGMTTVSALHYAGIIPSGLVALTPGNMAGVYTVSYSVQEGGEGTIIYWTGDWTAETPVEGSETLSEGETAKAVYAIPADDWLFVCWSDGKRDPYRQDTVSDSDIVVQAIFERLEADPEDGENQDPTEGDTDGEKQESDQQQEGEPEPGGDEEDGEQGDEEMDSPNEPSGDPQDDPTAGGMRDMSSQQIVDGKTYYGDEFDDAYRQAMERLSQDDNIPEELKKYIEDYYESIETGGETGGD